MSALEAPAFAALLANGCPSCGKRYFVARAIATGVMQFLDGEPASAMEWTTSRDDLPARVYRLECSECGATPFQRDDCPTCRAPGGTARALAGRHGIAAPKACPQCGLGDLSLTVEARMHVEYTIGREARRVLDAEPHEPGFHIAKADCADCDGTVVSVPEIRCGVCGRSSLLRRRPS